MKELTMSFRERVLTEAFDIVENFFNEWAYDSEMDIYRAKDVANALNSTQWDSKIWAANMISRYSEPGQSVMVMGGWYGLLAGLLSEHDLKVETIDLDPICKRIGKRLFPKVQFQTDDAYEFFMSRRNDFKWIINTSCEHMELEDVQAMVDYKGDNTFICFQSNNMFHEDSHINCYETLDEFVSDLHLKRVIFKGSLKIGEYNRWMVIGE